MHWGMHAPVLSISRSSFGFYAIPVLVVLGKTYRVADPGVADGISERLDAGLYVSFYTIKPNTNFMNEKWDGKE
jgi:hypothetical protein